MAIFTVPWVLNICQWFSLYLKIWYLYSWVYEVARSPLCAEVKNGSAPSISFSVLPCLLMLPAPKLIPSYQPQISIPNSHLPWLIYNHDWRMWTQKVIVFHLIQNFIFLCLHIQPTDFLISATSALLLSLSPIFWPHSCILSEAEQIFYKMVNMWSWMSLLQSFYKINDSA